MFVSKLDEVLEQCLHKGYCSFKGLPSFKLTSDVETQTLSPPPQCPDAVNEREELLIKVIPRVGDGDREC